MNEWAATISAHLGRAEDDPLVRQLATLLAEVAGGRMALSTASEQLLLSLAVAGLGPMIRLQAVAPNGFALCTSTGNPLTMALIDQRASSPASTMLDFGNAQIGSLRTGDMAMGDIHKYAPPHALRPEPVPPLPPKDSTTHSRQLIAAHQQRLQLLEQRAAHEGLHTAPEVKIEIDELKAEIERLEAQLRDLR